jgi:hypothetical protein
MRLPWQAGSPPPHLDGELFGCDATNKQYPFAKSQPIIESLPRFLTVMVHQCIVEFRFK